MLFNSYEAFEPHELGLMRAILEEACGRRGCSTTGLEAQKLARELVDWYQFGIKDRDELEKMLHPILTEHSDD
jgi:hypothetical protein